MLETACRDAQAQAGRERDAARRLAEERDALEKQMCSANAELAEERAAHAQSAAEVKQLTARIADGAHIARKVGELTPSRAAVARAPSLAETGSITAAAPAFGDGGATIASMCGTPKASTPWKPAAKTSAHRALAADWRGPADSPAAGSFMAGMGALELMSPMNERNENARNGTQTAASFFGLRAPSSAKR